MWPLSPVRSAEILFFTYEDTTATVANMCGAGIHAMPLGSMQCSKIYVVIVHFVILSGNVLGREAMCLAARTNVVSPQHFVVIGAAHCAAITRQIQFSIWRNTFYNLEEIYFTFSKDK